MVLMLEQLSLPSPALSLLGSLPSGGAVVAASGRAVSAHRHSVAAAGQLGFPANHERAAAVKAILLSHSTMIAVICVTVNGR